MSYIALFLLFILTVVSVIEGRDCSSQLPDGGSGVPDLQQVTILPYCFINECTIMRTDTGQELDIVYTSDSILVVNITGNQTSMAITKNEDEPPCEPTVADSETAEFVGLVVAAISIAVVSGCILLVHMLYKELRNMFGKLLMLYNGALCFQGIVAISLMITHFQIPANSQFVCQSIFFFYMLGDMAIEAFATCILAYLAYILYLSNRLQQSCESREKCFFRCSLVYFFCSLILFGSLIFARDMYTGNGRYTILPSGRCSYWASDYDTILIPRTNSAINKLIQITFFIVYLYYYCKLSCSNSTDEAVRKQSRQLFKIAVSFGATVGISEFIWVLEFFFSVDYITGIIAVTMLFIQQCIIMTSFMYYNRMSKVCGDAFKKKETSP